MKRVKIDLDKCPKCEVEFTSVNKTNHHAIPKFLNPKMTILIPLCKDCHLELNNAYLHSQTKKDLQDLQTMEKIENRGTSLGADFDSFNDKYLFLREQFHSRKIDRSKFGEGLWSNLMSYLETLEKRIK